MNGGSRIYTRLMRQMTVPRHWIFMIALQACCIVCVFYDDDGCMIDIQEGEHLSTMVGKGDKDIRGVCGFGYDGG
jgi:hypothetical protein